MHRGYSNTIDVVNKTTGPSISKWRITFPISIYTSTLHCSKTLMKVVPYTSFIRYPSIPLPNLSHCNLWRTSTGTFHYPLASYKHIPDAQNTICCIKATICLFGKIIIKFYALTVCEREFHNICNPYVPFCHYAQVYTIVRDLYMR